MQEALLPLAHLEGAVNDTNNYNEANADHKHNH